MSHPISDLQPATDYEAMVSVENKFGWSGDSKIFHFYTRKGEGVEVDNVKLSIYAMILAVSIVEKEREHK